jgi:hypothetical protein
MHMVLVFKVPHNASNTLGSWCYFQAEVRLQIGARYAARSMLVLSTYGSFFECF